MPASTVMMANPTGLDDWRMPETNPPRARYALNGAIPGMLVRARGAGPTPRVDQLSPRDDFGTDLENPNFAKLAEATGVLGLTAETPQDVRPTITQALKHDGPALVEVLVHRQELSMPPTISLAQMKGFTLFTLKAVLSGRGDEVVDLAKINLFR